MSKRKNLVEHLQKLASAEKAALAVRFPEQELQRAQVHGGNWAHDRCEHPIAKTFPSQILRDQWEGAVTWAA